MAKPARKTPAFAREHTVPTEEPGLTVLRWIERPDGGMEQVELPLTPERFLNPQVGDQMTQGRRHGETAAELAALLRDHFQMAPDVLVLFDVKHIFDPALPEPGPDVSVIRGVRDKEADRELRRQKRRRCPFPDHRGGVASRYPYPAGRRGNQGQDL